MINNFYFFAELSFDLAIWHGLINIIRDLKPGAHFELICSLDKRINSYDISPLIAVYDRVHHITGASFYSSGSWRRGLTARNIYSAIFRTFPDARRTYKHLQEISFAPDSIAFVHGCQNINQWLFLKRVKSAPKVKGVFFPSSDSPNNITLFNSDWDVNNSQSAFINIHTRFFGIESLDVYWIKTPESVVTNHRHFVFRDKPADFVFSPVSPARYKNLQDHQIFLPLLFVNKSKETCKKGTVLLVGGKYHWLQGLPNDAEKLFFEKLSFVIDLIRKKHSGQKLLYKSHPSQNKDDLKKTDLSGFEIESCVTSESIFLNDSSLQTVYSFNSTSVQTAASMGIQSFYLYNLFDLDELFLPASVQRHWNDRFSSELYPEMNIRSVDDWMNGRYDYLPADRTGQILKSTRKMLGILDSLDS